jgi:hypothetical protein
VVHRREDAHVEGVQCGLFASPYFKNGLRGLFAALVFTPDATAGPGRASHA